MEKGFGIGDANIFDLQNVFNPVKKFASDVIADVKENKADLLPYMGIGATTDIAGFPADMYSLYGQLRKGVGSPTLASVIGPQLEKVIGSEALLENISLPALKQMGIEPKRGTYTEDLGRILGLPGASLAVKAGTDISKGLGEVALKALKPDEVAMTPEGFAMPIRKDSSVLEMSGKASGTGQYSDELTKQIEGLEDTNPDIYKSAQAMVKGNNPEDRIKKMIESRLAPKQKVLTGTAEQDLNFVPTAKTFPEDPKMYLEQNYKYKDPNVKRADTANLFNSRMNYNNQPYSLEPRNKFVRERPIHFNSVVLARQALTDSPDGQLTGKEIYNQIKNSQLKDGGVKDKELKDTGLDILKDSDDVFELSPNQKSLINISGMDISSPDKLQLTLTKNQIVSRSNFISDYTGTPDAKDFDQVPFTDSEPIYVGESYPRMFEDNQRIGGENLAKQESLDYGIISINDPKSRFTAHISGDVPPEIAKGNIAWSRVSVREHPNGKKYLIPEEFQSDLHTKAQGSKDKPGQGYKLTEKEQEAADLDYENKSDIHNIEHRKLMEEIEKPFADSYYGSPFHMGLASELPDNLKPNYSVLGENANDIIRLKELHEDAIIDYLGDTSRTDDADNLDFWGGIDRGDANKAFNKVVRDISRSQSGEIDVGIMGHSLDASLPTRGSRSRKKYYDSVEKYAETRNNLIEKISKQKTSKIDEGLEADENYQQVKNRFDEGDISEDSLNSSANFRRGYLKNFQDELIEVELNTLSSKGIHTRDQMFSKVADLHSQIRDVIEPIEALLSEDKTKFYRNVWKTVSDLKKDPEFKKFKQTRDEFGIRKGEDETQAYVKNKFFEIADPNGELELKEHIELSMNERDFAQLISEIDSMVNPYTYASDVIRNLPYLEVLHSFRKNNPKDVLLDSVFELDQNSSNVKKYFETKKERDKAFQKSIDVSDIPYSPLPQQSEWTKVLMRDLVRTAADKGLDGVVLPNAQAYKYAGGRTDKLIEGYRNTTIPAFKSVAKEIDADVDTIEWKGWTSEQHPAYESFDDLTANNEHLVIPVNKNLSGTSTRGYKEGGQVGSLGNVNVLDLGERVNG